jgi:hypothetical protein
VSYSFFCHKLIHCPFSGELNQSIKTLVRYRSDRRPKLRAALEAIGITPENQSDIASPLSETSVDDLFALPNTPLAALTPEQLLRFAQIVDTALYKSYLIIWPALLGSLCRIANWCEVTEVEEDLRSRKVGLFMLAFFGRKDAEGYSRNIQSFEILKMARRCIRKLSNC